MSEYKNDGVDHPPHYNAHPAGIECIDVVEHFGFNIGNAMKYLWRAGLKPGEDMIKDLEKACWYVQREIERAKKRSKREDRVIKNALVTWALITKHQYENTKAFVNSHLSVVDASNLPLKPQSHVSAVILDEIKPLSPVCPCCGKHCPSEHCKDCDGPWKSPCDKHQTDENQTPKDVTCSDCGKPGKDRGPDGFWLIKETGIYVCQEHFCKHLEATGYAPAEEITLNIDYVPEAAKEPAKKPDAEPSGTSEEDTVDPIAEKSAVVSNSKSPQKPCKDCGAPYDRSDWHRFKGICAVCRKMQRDKALAEKIAMLNEADVRIGPDRNKPEPPKETLNKIISADYLLKRLKHDYPARGEFLVEDAMRITEMPFRDTLQLLQLIGEDRVKAISPAELKSQQKWKLVKETKNATN